MIVDSVLCHRKGAIMDEDTIQLVRLKAFEEMRQHLKHADWDISSVMVVEDAIRTLSCKKPDKRYHNINRVFQD